MDKITVLGTSGASPTKERGLTSVALVHEGSVLLFDCGEGTQMQLLKYNVNSSKIKAIFVSHAHGDHIIGIAGLVRTLGLNGRKAPLSIFVPKGYEGVIRSLIVFDKAVIEYPVTITGISAGSVYKEKDFTVSAFKEDHTISTYGYVFKINDRRKFDAVKSKRLGIKGPMFSELLRKGTLRIGKAQVKLTDVTHLQIGKKIVYAADTRPSKSTISAAKNADLLIHEATYAETERNLALERKHSTAAEAAQVAKKAKVSRLLLIHFSARYKTTQQLENEAKRIFKNTILADDGYNTFI